MSTIIWYKNLSESYQKTDIQTSNHLPEAWHLVFQNIFQQKH